MFFAYSYSGLFLFHIKNRIVVETNTATCCIITHEATNLRIKTEPVTVGTDAPVYVHMSGVCASYTDVNESKKPLYLFQPV